MADVVVLKDFDLSGRDFRNVRCNLMGAGFINVNFDNTNFEGACFRETFFIGCSFRGANLRHANMTFSRTCDLTDAILGGTMENLTAEQIQSTWNFKNKDFSNIRFSGGAFPDMEYDSSFNFANSGSDGGTVFPVDKFNFDDCEWNRLPLGLFPSHPIDDGSPGWWGVRRLTIGDQAFRTREFRQKSLHGLTISDIDFHGCDFSGFTLGLFVGCNFHNANFKDAGILNKTISASSMIPSMIPGRFGFVISEKFDKFGFVRCKITKEQIEQTRFWKEGDLRGIILEDMNLDGWDFSNKDLSYASLKGSSVRDANFENATIYYTNLSVLGMTDSGLLRQELQGRERYETRQWFSTFTIEQLKSTKSWKEKKIAYCTLRWVNFDDCDLSGFNLVETRLAGCSFNNANLAGADTAFDSGGFVGHKGLTEQQVRSLKRFEERWLLLRE